MISVRDFYRKIRYGKCKSFAKPLYFFNNAQGSNTVCLILAGYKPFTWEIIFKRIKIFCPNNIDVCIVSSGIYSKELKQCAELNGWSYVSMKRNCVTLALNSAIKLFPKAEKIFKIDEDIFITDGFFDILSKIHEVAKKDYFPVFTAPLIPINGYGYRRILEKLNLIDEYSNRFEYPRVSAGRHMQLESNPEVAKFFWGEKNKVPQIDRLNRIIKNNYKNDIGGGVFCLSYSLFYRCNLLREKFAREGGLVSC